MVVIGLTGGIASGKSTAARALGEMGAEVIDADAISRRLTEPGGAAAPAVVERFGTLDRKALAQIVFSDAAARADLNAIVHPMVKAEMERCMHAAERPVVVLDVPLLYESGMDAMCDAVWVVHVPREVQIKRVMARDGLPREAAQARIDAQMPTAEKVRRADAAIDTSGPHSRTRAQLQTLYDRAYAAAQPPPPPPDGGQRRRRSQHLSVPKRPDLGATIREAAQSLAAHLPEHIFEEDALQALPPPETVDAWEDTSTVLDIPPRRSFFARQSPLFWLASGILLISLLTLVGVIGVRTWREGEAARQEIARQQLLAEEKARYQLHFRDAIEANAAEHAVDPALVAAVIYNESRFDPEAVSRLGARGLMQIMQDTGQWIAQKLGEEEGYTFDRLFTPDVNIRYGTWYLGYLSRLFEGDIVKIAAGYHAGQNAVRGWLENPEYSGDGRTLTAIPYPDTEQYVRRVVDTYEIYRRHYYAPETPVEQAA